MIEKYNNIVSFCKLNLDCSYLELELKDKILAKIHWVNYVLYFKYNLSLSEFKVFNKLLTHLIRKYNKMD